MSGVGTGFVLFSSQPFLDDGGIGVQMKTLVGSALLLVSIVAAPPLHAAGSSSAATGDVSATVNIGDIQFDGSECVYVPWSVDWTFAAGSADVTSGTAAIEMRQPGSSSSNSDTAFFYGDEALSGTEQEEIFFCPFEYTPGQGAFQVTGSLKSSNYRTDSEQTVPLTPMTVNVIQNPTTLGPIKVKKTRFGHTISGTATAATVTKGVVGAGGNISIEIRKPKSKRWRGGLQAFPNSFGEWSTSAGRLPKGTQIRVTLVDCAWCTEATRTARVKR